MAKQMPRKNSVKSMATLRRSAMMGAAATALVVATPMLHAETRAAQAMTPRAAVRDVLSTAWRDSIRSSSPVAFALVSVTNDENITVGPDETALPLSSTEDDISLINTGDLTGGIGIDVYTGALDLDNAVSDDTFSRVYTTSYLPLYDDYGLPVYDGDGNPVTAVTGELAFNDRVKVLARDPLESRITIDNSGAIAFAGEHAIRAVNPAGESISIVNSGDITSTADTPYRSGIHASTETFQVSGSTSQTAGEFTYNSYGQLTGVITPYRLNYDTYLLDMEYDAGAISIDNTGNIDMGATEWGYAYYVPSGFLSAGISTRGDGGTTITNSGDITVDDWSAGIHASSTAATSITNSGRIEIGNQSLGISIAPSSGNAGDYRLGGDVYVLNTGDIVGGVSWAEADPVFGASVTGISIASLGSNNEYFAGLAHVNELFAAYNEALGSEVYELFDIPNTRLYTTTAVNRGLIELADGGRGIGITPAAGASTAINEGTIIVGDGIGFAAANFNVASAGIFQNNFSANGMGSTTSVNTESGIIVTGDDGFGIANYNIGGTSIAINEGLITTGNGITGSMSMYGEDYDRLFSAKGINSISAARTFGTLSYARNSGSITVGDLAIGVAVSGQGYQLLDPYAPSAIAVNEGIIQTGDNSGGMFTTGTIATTYNSGRITTGDFDLGEFNPHPVFTADEFAQLQFGVASSALALADVANFGTITTGDGTIGAAAYMTYSGYGVAARVIQGEDGVIATGDDAIGVKVLGGYEGIFENQGTITVGNDSIGAHVSAGSVHLRYAELTATVTEGTVLATNTGIIETGDNSVGVRVQGFLDDVAYSGVRYVPYGEPVCGYFGCYYNTERVEIEGTADAVGSAYFVNTGTIRVGAESTAVEITGEGAGFDGLHLFNTGTLQASTGTALSVNAGNDIGSYVVNVGTIAGDIIFGAGDDRFMHTAMLNDAGALESTGNLVMNGTTIDFGAGSNRFDIDRAQITLSGGQSSILGADLFLNGASIEARDGLAVSSLLIDGNVSGSLVFGADFAPTGADEVVITGDLAEGSAVSLVLTPTTQMSGESTFTVITVEGENGANLPLITGIGGQYADSLQSAEVNYSAATGEISVTALFGMGQLATAATSATTMAQNWWMQSVSSLGNRDMQKVAGKADNGLSVWGAFFHDEGTIEPGNELQDTSFNQKLTGLQSGIEWSGEFAGGLLSAGPMISYGDASANLNANLASARGNAWAVGLNANYRFANGLYVDAVWQTLSMEIDLRAPGTASNATGETDADGDGFSLEVGYAHVLSSGLTLAPQLQYATVDLDLDDLQSSDAIYDFTSVGGKSSVLRAGLAVFKTFESENGFVTPLASLNYLDVADGESALRSNGVAFANDTSGSGYQLELGIAGRYKAWDITGQVGLTDTSASKQSLSTNMNVRYRW